MCCERNDRDGPGEGCGCCRRCWDSSRRLAVAHGLQPGADAGLPVGGNVHGRRPAIESVSLDANYMGARPESWQFERRLYTSNDGVTALMEWVPLISGLEQGVALPSLNWLAGIRTASGVEFGIGPNITPVGVGLVVAAGVTVRSGALNVPLNVALASSSSGLRVSVMTGFNIRK